MKYRHRMEFVAVIGCFVLLPLAGCGGSPGPFQQTGGSGGSSGSVAFAQSMLDGKVAPDPGPFQQDLLDKTSLTYADYESAMQAMAQCVEDRLPGSVVTLTPGQYQPDTFDYSMDFGNGGDLAEAGEDAGSVPSDVATVDTSNADSSMPVKPESVIAGDRAQGECMLIYSAYVADKWQQQLVTGSSEEQVQKPQFLQCLTAAGVNVPQDTSNANLKKWLQTPVWYEGLTPQQSDQANQCLKQYATLVNTITR